MRSRYTAFALKEMDYVAETTDPQTVVALDMAASKEWAETAEFYKLEVLRSTDEGNKGVVEFKAHFRLLKDGSAQVHHEVAKFRKRAGVWYFRDGRVIANPS
jgi:SEC-C motif domain protein